MAANEKELVKILRKFISTSQSIEAAAVMTRDGHLLASQFNRDVNADRLSAISAS